MVVENYPELNSNQLMQNVQAELAGTENRIGVERLRYNDDVRLYNTYIQVFPNNLVSKAFHFDKKVPFQSSLGADNVREVRFGQ